MRRIALVLLICAAEACFASILGNLTLYGTDVQGNIRIAQINCFSAGGFYGIKESLNCNIRESTIIVNKNGSCEFQIGLEHEGKQNYEEPDNISLKDILNPKYVLTYSFTKKDSVENIEKIFFSKNSITRYEIDMTSLEKLAIIDHIEKIVYNKKIIKNECKNFASE